MELSTDKEEAFVEVQNKVDELPEAIEVGANDNVQVASGAGFTVTL